MSTHIWEGSEATRPRKENEGQQFSIEENFGMKERRTKGESKENETM